MFESIEDLVDSLIAQGASDQEIEQAMSEFQGNQSVPTASGQPSAAPVSVPAGDPGKASFEQEVDNLIASGASDQQIDNYLSGITPQDQPVITSEVEAEQQVLSGLGNDFFEKDKDSIEARFDKGQFKTGEREAYDLYKNSKEETGKGLLDPKLLGYEYTPEEAEREAKRREEIPDWIRGSDILEGAYHTITNQFPQAFKGIQLAGKSAAMEENKAKLAQLQQSLDGGGDPNALVNVGGRISPRTGATIGGTSMPLSEAVDHYKSLLKEQPAQIIDKLSEISQLQEESELFHHAEFLDEEGITAKDMKSAIGAQVPQLAFSALTFGVGAFGQEYGHAYIDNLMRIAEEKYRPADWPEGQPYEPTQEELYAIIEDGEDQRGVAVGVGAVSGALEFIGAKHAVGLTKAAGTAVIGKLLRDNTKNTLGKLGAVRIGSAMLEGGLVEGLTESAQGLAQDFGSGIARKKTFDEITDEELSFHKSAEEFVQGGFIGALLPGMGGATRAIGGRYRNIKNEDGSSEALDSQKTDELTPDEYKPTLDASREQRDKAKSAGLKAHAAGKTDLSLIHDIMDEKRGEINSSVAENYNTLQGMTDGELASQNQNAKTVAELERQKQGAASDEEIELIQDKIDRTKIEMSDRFAKTKAFPEVLESTVNLNGQIEGKNQKYEAELTAIETKVNNGLSQIEADRKTIAETRKALAAAPEPNPVSTQSLNAREQSLDAKEAELLEIQEELTNPDRQTFVTKQAQRAKEIRDHIAGNRQKQQDMWGEVSSFRPDAANLVEEARILSTSQASEESIARLKEVKEALIGNISKVAPSQIPISNEQTEYLARLAAKDNDLIDMKSLDISQKVLEAKEEVDPSDNRIQRLQAVTALKQAARSIIRADVLNSGATNLSLEQANIINTLAEAESAGRTAAYIDPIERKAEGLYRALLNYELSPESDISAVVSDAISKAESSANLQPAQVIGETFDIGTGRPIDWRIESRNESLIGGLTGYADLLTPDQKKKIFTKDFKKKLAQDDVQAKEYAASVLKVFEQNAIRQGREIAGGKGFIKGASQDLITPEDNTLSVLVAPPDVEVASRPVNAFNNLSMVLRAAAKTYAAASRGEGVTPSVSQKHRDLSKLKQELSGLLSSPVNEIISLEQDLAAELGREGQFQSPEKIIDLENQIAAEKQILADNSPRAEKIIDAFTAKSQKTKKQISKQLNELGKAREEFEKNSKEYGELSTKIGELITQRETAPTFGDFTKIYDQMKNFEKSYQGPVMEKARLIGKALYNPSKLAQNGTLYIAFQKELAAARKKAAPKEDRVVKADLTNKEGTKEQRELYKAIKFLPIAGAAARKLAKPSRALTASDYHNAAYVAMTEVVSASEATALEELATLSTPHVNVGKKAFWQSPGEYQKKEMDKVMALAREKGYKDITKAINYISKNAEKAGINKPTVATLKRFDRIRTTTDPEVMVKEIYRGAETAAKNQKRILGGLMSMPVDIARNYRRIEQARNAFISANYGAAPSPADIFNLLSEDYAKQDTKTKPPTLQEIEKLLPHVASGWTEVSEIGEASPEGDTTTGKGTVQIPSDAFDPSKTSFRDYDRFQSNANTSNAISVSLFGKGITDKLTAEVAGVINNSRKEIQQLISQGKEVTPEILDRLRRLDDKEFDNILRESMGTIGIAQAFNEHVNNNLEGIHADKVSAVLNDASKIKYETKDKKEILSALKFILSSHDVPVKTAAKITAGVNKAGLSESTQIQSFANQLQKSLIKNPTALDVMSFITRPKLGEAEFTQSFEDQLTVYAHKGNILDNQRRLVTKEGPVTKAKRYVAPDAGVGTKLVRFTTPEGETDFAYEGFWDTDNTFMSKKADTAFRNLRNVILEEMQFRAIAQGKVNGAAPLFEGGITAALDQTAIVGEQSGEIGIGVDPDLAAANNSISLDDRAEVTPNTTIDPAVISVAPFYDTTIKSIKDADKLRKSKPYKAHIKNLKDSASILGLNISGIDNVVGGFFNAEGTKVVEVSTKVKIDSNDINKLMDYAALTGATAPQTQESSIAGVYAKEGGPSNGAEYSIAIAKDDSVFKLLDQAGINDYSYDDTTGELSIFQSDIAEYADPELDQKLDTLGELFKQNNLNYGEITQQRIQSEYIDPQRATEILTSLEDRSQGKQKGRVRTAAQQALAERAAFDQSQALKEKQKQVKEKKDKTALYKKIKRDLELKNYPLRGKRRESLVYAAKGKYAESKISQRSRDVLLATRLHFSQVGADMSIAQLEKLEKAIDMTIKDGYKDQLDRRKERQAKREKIAETANDIITGKIGTDKSITYPGSNKEFKSFADKYVGDLAGKQASQIKGQEAKTIVESFANTIANKWGKNIGISTTHQQIVSAINGDRNLSEKQKTDAINNWKNTRGRAVISDDGKIQLLYNDKLFDGGTPLHEFSHLWELSLNVDATGRAIKQAMRPLMKDSKHFDKVAKDLKEKYPELKKGSDMYYNEMFAQLMSKEMQYPTKGTAGRQLQEMIIDLFNHLASLIGADTRYTNFSQVRNAVVKDLLAGEKAKTRVGAFVADRAQKNTIGLSLDPKTGKVVVDNDYLGDVSQSAITSADQFGLEKVEKDRVINEFANRKRFFGINAFGKNLKRDKFAAITNLLSPAANDDFYGLAERLLPAFGIKRRDAAKKAMNEAIMDPLAEANARGYNNQADFRDDYKNLKRETLGKKADKILDKASPIEKSGAKLTNSQVSMFYNWIKDPTLHRKLKMNIAQMNQIVDYIQQNPALEKFSDGVVDLYASRRSMINRDLNRNGFKGVNGRVFISTKGDPKTFAGRSVNADVYSASNAELELLSKVYKGNIPSVAGAQARISEIQKANSTLLKEELDVLIDNELTQYAASYTPFAADPKEEKLIEANFNLFEEGGNFQGYSALAGNLKARQEGGEVSIAGRNVDSMIDRYATGPLRSVAYLDFAKNATAFFNTQNLRQAELNLGKTWGSAMRDSLRRIITGKMEAQNTPQQYKDMHKWLNRSIGGIMFLNSKSALLQLISMPNFMTENPIGYMGAIADRKAMNQAKDIIKRSGFYRLRGAADQDVVMDALAKQEGRGFGRAIDKALTDGYILTKAFDRMAIRQGGMPYVAAKLKELKQKHKNDKEWTDERIAFEAEKAFVHKANQAQQSTAPDRLGQIQTSAAGRYILAFTNATQQFNRVMASNLRDAQALMAGSDVTAQSFGRGLAKLMNVGYFLGGQYMLFSFAQKAMANANWPWEDEEDEDEKKWDGYWTALADSLLTSTGLTGTYISTLATALYKAGAFTPDDEKSWQQERKANEIFLSEIINIGPSIGTKTREFSYGFLNKRLFPQSALSKDIPEQMVRDAYKIQAVTGIPAARSLRIIEGFADPFVSEDLSIMDNTFKAALRATGWSRYDLQQFIEGEYSQEDYRPEVFGGGQEKKQESAFYRGETGQTFRDGSIEVDPNLSPIEREKTIAHEQEHVRQMQEHGLDYDDNNVYWEGRSYPRKEGKIKYNGKWHQEGTHALPWEGGAYAAEKKSPVKRTLEQLYNY